MKKRFLLCGLFILGSVFLLSAQDIDTQVKNAVDRLTSRLPGTIDASVGEIYLLGSQSTSELSRYLYNKIVTHALENPKLKLAAPSRGIVRIRVGDPQKGIIKGVFLPSGNFVNVTLQLVIESLAHPYGEIFDTADFSIPVTELQENNIKIYPANMDILEEINDDIIPYINPIVMEIDAWPNSDSYTYFGGDELQITIESSADCFFKIYHIDVDNKIQLLFPDETDQNNQLQAYVKRTIPDPQSLRFVIQAPYGQDSIIVIASKEQFTNIEADFSEIHSVTAEILAGIMRGRGIMTQDTDNTPPIETAVKRFSFTSLPSTYYDEVYTYRKPDNITEAIQTIRDYLVLLGGSITGNDREGTFITSETEGIYRVSGDAVTVSLRYTGNQFVASLPRGGGFNFTIDKPRDMTQAVQSVRSGIEAKGGTFSGDEQQGSFRASGIAGHYNVAEQVNVNISEKPFLIPNSLIEKEVKNYFTGK